jgi:hypothetical protein
MTSKKEIPYEDREENNKEIPFVAQRTEREIAFSNFLINRRKIEEAYKTIRDSKQKIKEIGEQFPEILRMFNSNLKKKRKQEESESEEETEDERRKRMRREEKGKAKLEKFLERKKEKKQKAKEGEGSTSREMSEAEIAREGGRARPYDLRRQVKFTPIGEGRSRMDIG